jgi:hypothetical protein
MKTADIRHYVMRYLEATNCHIMEKSPAHVTVKLSPEADKELTNRSYYWNFIERTGAEPETMTYSFVFDPEAMGDQPQPEKKPNPPAANGGNDTILGRYFGFVPSAPGPATGGRILKETLTYGCRRLDQIFQSAKNKGRFLHLFEEPAEQKVGAFGSNSYSTWLGVNFKAELTCDMRRNEIHTLGISLCTGEITERFHDLMHKKKLIPRLPPNTHIRETISLPRALAHLETHLEKKLMKYDHKWAEEAQERMREEMFRIEAYYEELIKAADEENKQTAIDQFENRKKEIEWQYRPRVEVSVVNCGIFHLTNDSFHGF